MWYWIALPSRSRTRKVETCVGQQRRYNESSVRHSETENTYSAEGAVCSRTYECVREAVERKSERQGEHVASGGDPSPSATTSPKVLWRFESTPPPSAKEEEPNHHESL